MKINRKSPGRYLLLPVCLLVFPLGPGIPVAKSQELIEPTSKAHLISAFKLNRREKNPLKKMTVEGFIRLINRYGVEFPLTPEAEQEIRRAGDYFGKTELDKLVTALRNNYRPDEPTEAEMKEALLRPMEERGGKRIADDVVEISNEIAGVAIKIEKFEKLGCAPPNYGPGYFCSYNISTPVTMVSPDERVRGHLDALTRLISWLSLGSGVGTERITRKFVWSKDRWLVSNE